MIDPIVNLIRDKDINLDETLQVMKLDAIVNQISSLQRIKVSPAARPPRALSIL